MSNTSGTFSQLAGLFSYPDREFSVRVRGIQSRLDEESLAAAHELREFTDFVSGATLLEIEELYTRSFDVQALTTLDLGYVLFGDDYKRGELLVNLNREHRDAGIECGGELPDHLPNVLCLLDAMQDDALRRELVQKIIAPALRRMIAEFDPERMEKKNAIYVKHHKTLIERSERYGLFYQKTLRALYEMLAQNFDVGTDEDRPMLQRSAFLGSIGTEMVLECNKGNCDVSHQ